MEFIDVLKDEVHIASLGSSYHIIHISAKNLAVSKCSTTVHEFFAEPVVILKVIDTASGAQYAMHQSFHYIVLISTWASGSKIQQHPSVRGLGVPFLFHVFELLLYFHIRLPVLPL